MPDLGVILALFAGGATAVQIAGRVFAKVRAVERDIDVRREALRNLSVRGRETAKSILKIKREMRSLEAEAVSAAGNAEKVQESVTRLEAQARQLYVLEDIRTPEDHPFVIRVYHHDFAKISPSPPRPVARAWKAGRAYLVWAADPDKATAKVRLRFRADRGYAVSTAAAFDGGTSLL
jgi:hypothetical protein